MSQRDVEAEAADPLSPPPARWMSPGSPGLSRLPLRLGNLRADLAQILESELEAGRAFLWLPVLFSIGVVFYFALPREPSAVALTLAAAGAVMAAVRARRHRIAGRVLFVAAAVLAGATAMKIRTDLVAAPVLPREMTATIAGWVSAREATPSGGSRVYIRVASIERLPADRVPDTVRITLRTKAPISVGDAISVVARVQPPSGPALPGGYDFALAAFYARIGGIGFAYGNPKPAGLGPVPLDIRFAAPLAHLRETIRDRITAALPGERGAIAAALVMGDQGGVSDETQDEMRASGLGHVLSISGLHMALVAGWAFIAIRAFLALFPGLALRHPIKKWAALAALGVATFYLGISGGGVATDRSYIMIAIMFIAILVGRRALTLRNVALAAILILAFYPESVLSVSFQMSFAATIALVAGYEAIARGGGSALPDGPRGYDLGGRLWRAVIGLAITSLLAGLATTPFAIYHFQRAAPLSLVANMVAAPAISTLIMIPVLPTLLLMPFGLEALPLAPMGWGIDWMTLVAREATSWSEGYGGVRMIPALALLLFAAGFLWLALWQQRWRFAGFVPMALAVPVALAATPPDVLVSEDGGAAAVRAADGRYRILGKPDEFIVINWLRADADPRKPDDPSLKEGVRCDLLGCTADMPWGGIAALADSVSALIDDCPRASVIVSHAVASRLCGDRATVIDRRVTGTGGSVALYRSGDRSGGFAIVTAYPVDRRPFMPPVRKGQ